MALDTDSLDAVLNDLQDIQKRMSFSNLLNAEDGDFIEIFSDEEVAQNDTREL